MPIPEFATHYFLPENGPFKSLSSLEGGGDNPIFLELLNRHQHDPAYRRRFGREYIQRRRETEQALRELFIARGGAPQVEHPLYLTLGMSAWFKGLNESHQEISIPLAKLNPATTSVTFPDSFMTMSRADKPYFKQVFLLDELEAMAQRFGIPNNDHLVPYEKYWETDFELYVEIQVWDKAETLLTA
ncbi:hypothetical protein [Deefgea rivuli]|uniref:hypothetical protein n=1 Tax=Deefgea rivuli TaxID=400948 RepID=UPI00055C0646|nr:hypothetical protein [Deefgea rivuli]